MRRQSFGRRGAPSEPQGGELGKHDGPMAASETEHDLKPSDFETRCCICGRVKKQRSSPHGVVVFWEAAPPPDPKAMNISHGLCPPCFVAEQKKLDEKAVRIRQQRQPLAARTAGSRARGGSPGGGNTEA